MAWPSPMSAADLIDQLRDACRVLRVAVDDELVALRPDLDVEQRFEVAEVFVVGPEEGLDGGLRDRDLAQRCRLRFAYLLVATAI